jgi:DNA processing protein
VSSEAWLRLAFLGLHPERVRRLFERHGDADRVVGAVESGVEAVGTALLGADECRRRVAGAGVAFDVAAGASWATSFEHVVDPPFWLFREGPLPAERRVAIVGTRQCTEYGRRLAFEFGVACVAAGWVVVSGLARGIDGAAHRGAVAGDGRTVAVLGCGSDVMYPRQHASLRSEILAGGGSVVTEYAPGASPLPWRFPPRNRIISGLSAAVVVVETPATGGSLSTAARAVAQNRTVFAVPGDVDRTASVGCNLLIRDGAIPALGADDLVEALSLVAGGWEPRSLTPLQRTATMGE